LLPAIFLVGCSGGDAGDGLKPEDVKAVTDISTLAKSVGGDYDKLSAADKKKVLAMANNNEASAKALVYQMAHPPSEMNAGRGGGAGAPPTPGK